jgi:hypothetical protein
MVYILSLLCYVQYVLYGGATHLFGGAKQTRIFFFFFREIYKETLLRVRDDKLKTWSFGEIG